MKSMKTPNLNNKVLDKKFFPKETDNEICNCWDCVAQKNKMKIVQRDNFSLSVMFGFGQ